MRQKNLDLIISMFFAIMEVGWVLFPDRPPILGIVLALPLVFFLPGYTLAEVMFYKRPHDETNQLIRKPKLKIDRPFNTSDRIILGIGLSLVIDILSGFILNLLPTGLRPLPWAVFLGILTTVFSLCATYLRRRALIPMAKSVSHKFHIAIHEYILFGLALIVVVLSILSSSINSIQQQHPGFTQLWVLPSNQINNGCAVSIGIHSFESTPITFRVVMTNNKSQIIAKSPIILTPQGEWDQVVSIKPSTSNNMYIEVQLYRVDEPGTVYRDVHLTLHSLKGGKNGQGQQCTT